MNQRALLLAVPILFGTGMIGGGIAWLLTVQLTSGTAKGAPIRLTLSDSCADAAISARLAEWGLPATWDGRTVTFPGPGQPDDATHMPEALLRPGKLELREGDTVLDVHVRHAGVQLSVEGLAVSLVTLDKAVAPTITATLDGEPLTVGSVNGGEVQFENDQRDNVAALRQATDRVVWLRYPLPCAVEVTPG